MRPCPECGESVADDRRLCPHCGAAMPLPGTPLNNSPGNLPVWPPPPSGYDPLPPAGPGPLLTKSVRGDVILGFVVGLALCVGLPLLTLLLGSKWDSAWLLGASVLWGGVLGPTILALAYQKKLPSFARGAKYCAWTQGAILLGALALCFSQLARTIGR